MVAGRPQDRLGFRGGAVAICVWWTRTAAHLRPGTTRRHSITTSSWSRDSGGCISTPTGAGDRGVAGPAEGGDQGPGDADGRRGRAWVHPMVGTLLRAAQGGLPGLLPNAGRRRRGDGGGRRQWAGGVRGRDCRKACISTLRPSAAGRLRLPRPAGPARSRPSGLWRLWSGLSLGRPDVVWSQVDRDTGDLMLVENFR